MRNNKIYAFILFTIILSGLVFFLYKSNITEKTKINNTITKSVTDNKNAVSKEIKKDAVKNDFSIDKTMKKYSTNIDFLKCKKETELDDYSCLNNIINTKI
jgi:hypothetical protein